MPIHTASSSAVSSKDRHRKTATKAAKKAAKSSSQKPTGTSASQAQRSFPGTHAAGSALSSDTQRSQAASSQVSSILLRSQAASPSHKSIPALTAQAKQTLVSALSAQHAARTQPATPAPAHNKLTAPSASLLPAKADTQTSSVPDVQLTHSPASTHSCSTAAAVVGPTCIAGTAQSAGSTQAVPPTDSVYRRQPTVPRSVPAVAAHAYKSGPTTSATQAMASTHSRPSASKASSSGGGLQVLLLPTVAEQHATHAPDRQSAKPAVCPPPEKQHMNATLTQRLGLEVHELALFTHPAMAERGLQLLKAAEGQYGVVCELPGDSSRHDTVFVKGVKLQVSS